MPAQRMEAPITIGEAVRSIVAQKYLLPSIQREFVWSGERTESLFDSLLRGYPVGSFLFWKVEASNSRKYRFYEFMQNWDEQKNRRLKPIEILDPRELIVILDGQQRLTSFTIGLVGYRAERMKYRRASSANAYPKKKLYLNLTAPYPANEMGLDRVYDFRFLTDAEVAKNADIVWFPVSSVMDFAKGEADYDTGKLIRYTISKQLTDHGGEALTRLCDALLKTPTIHYFREDEQSLQTVLNIFVRLNSGGVPLSYSDLLLSIASAQWKTDAREAVFGLVDDLNAIGYHFDFDKDFVLKAALVLTDRPDIGFNVDNFDRTNTEAIEAGWEKQVRNPLLLAAELVASFGFDAKTLTSNNVLLPVAYYLRNLGCPDDFLANSKYESSRKQIREWMIKGLLKSVFSAKTDTVLSAVRKAVADSTSAEFPLDDIAKTLLVHNVNLRFLDEEIDALLETEYGTRNAFSVLALLYPRLNVSFTFHMDHIHPYSKMNKRDLKAAGLGPDDIEFAIEHRNELPNLQFLNGIANQQKLATPFDAWIAPMLTNGSWSGYCQEHHIPSSATPTVGDYHVTKFRTFFEGRAMILKGKLKELLA